jgi:hypothetical protein
MGKADYLKLGDYNAICYECGRKRKAGDLKRHWQGYWVCPEHWEARHPQDFVKGTKDTQTPPWAQPVPAAVFTDFCTPGGLTAIVDTAVVDCAVVDYISPAYDPTVTY